MSRFFLHLTNGTGFVADEEGQSWPRLSEARASAIDSIRSIVSLEAGEGRLDLHGRIDVAEADGTIKITIPFEDAFREGHLQQERAPDA